MTDHNSRPICIQALVTIRGRSEPFIVMQQHVDADTAMTFGRNAMEDLFGDKVKAECLARLAEALKDWFYEGPPPRADRQVLLQENLTPHGSAQCYCDLDNWQPDPRTGHTTVCQIHKALTAPTTEKTP
jgi:hypothetical protein